MEDERVQIVAWLCQGPKVWELSWVRLIDCPLEVGLPQVGLLEVGPLQDSPPEVGFLQASLAEIGSPFVILSSVRR
jgi:hypothetical protein